MQEELMNERDAARRLCLSVRTLQVWRWRKRGPRFLKLAGGAVRYRAEDLEQFMAASVCETRDTRPAADGES